MLARTPPTSIDGFQARFSTGGGELVEKRRTVRPAAGEVEPAGPDQEAIRRKFLISGRKFLPQKHRVVHPRGREELVDGVFGHSNGPQRECEGLEVDPDLDAQGPAERHPRRVDETRIDSGEDGELSAAEPLYVYESGIGRR